MVRVTQTLIHQENCTGHLDVTEIHADINLREEAHLGLYFKWSITHRIYTQTLIFQIMGQNVRHNIIRDLLTTSIGAHTPAALQYRETRRWKEKLTGMVYGTGAIATLKDVLILCRKEVSCFAITFSIILDRKRRLDIGL